MVFVLCRDFCSCLIDYQRCVKSRSWQCHGPPIGWTENSLKHEEFKGSDWTNCGFGISTWTFCNKQEMGEIYF